MQVAVAFVASSYNKYSICSLAGAVDSTPAVANTPLYFLSDRHTEELTGKLLDLLAKYERIFVCFSFATTNIARVCKLLGSLKKTIGSSRAVFIAGGPHATGDWQGTLAMGFDIAAIGEAEESFPELIGALSSGLDWQKIKGIAYIKDGTIVKTGKRDPVDLNRFAPFSLKYGKLSPIEISRGCPHACRFCQTSFIFGLKMRHRSIEEIIKYIELSKKNGTRDFRFISPDALAYGSKDGKTANLGAVENLLKEAAKITGKGHLFFGSFPSEVRPEAVSEDALRLITCYTATKQIVMGAQTGSQRMLDLLHRGHTVGDIYKAVKLTLNAGFEVSVDFIFGLPGETEADRMLSLKMIDKLTALGAKIHSHTFMPLPGTPLADSQAGTVDAELAIYLSRLANKGLQFGQWKKQQDLANEAYRFRQNINTKLGNFTIR